MTPSPISPAAPHASATLALPLVTPPLLRRMACWMYEGILLFGVVFLAGYLFSTLSQTRNALDNRLPHQIFIFIVFGIYFVWFWGKGQTLAMKTWNIRIVDRAGRPLTQTRALLRYALAWLWFVPPLVLSWVAGWSGVTGGTMLLLWIVLWALLSWLHPKRQFWHDAWAGTRLITWVTPDAPKRAKRTKK